METSLWSVLHEQYVMIYRVEERENGNFSVVSVAKKAVGDVKGISVL